MKMTSSFTIALLSATVCFFTGCGNEEPPAIIESALLTGSGGLGFIRYAEEEFSPLDNCFVYMNTMNLHEGYNSNGECFAFTIDLPGFLWDRRLSLQELKLVALARVFRNYLECMQASFSDEGGTMTELSNESNDASEVDGQSSPFSASSTLAAHFNGLSVKADEKIEDVVVEKDGKKEVVESCSEYTSLSCSDTKILEVTIKDDDVIIDYDMSMFSKESPVDEIISYLMPMGIDVVFEQEYIAVNGVVTHQKKQQLKAIVSEMRFVDFAMATRALGDLISDEDMRKFNYAAIVKMRVGRPILD